MANPFAVDVPQINALQALMQGYDFTSGVRRRGEVDSARQEAQQAIMGGGDTRGALARLLGAGDVQGANALANFGNQSLDQQYKMGMLDLQRRIAERKEEPENIRTVRAAGIDPASPEGRKALFPRTDTPISATDKKAIFEAEDAAPQLKGTVEALDRALQLNDKTFTGWTAGARGAIGTKMPGGSMLVDKNAALATEEWSKIMGPEALQTMASTLKGATTDFELRKFIEMLGDPSTAPNIRKSIIQRMKTLAERKMQINDSRLNELRGGTYFQPGGGASGAPAAPPAPRGAPETKTIGNRTFIKQNGQWYEQ